jgi:hypothetical protein
MVHTLCVHTLVLQDHSCTSVGERFVALESGNPIELWIWVVQKTFAARKLLPCNKEQHTR